MLQTIEPRAGDHIEHVFAEALAKAITSDRPVAFTFNGDRWNVQPTDSHPDLVARWQAKMEADAKAYRESPEGRAAAAQRAAEAAAHQVTVDLLVGQLPALLVADASDNRGLLTWLIAFAEAADDVGVRFDKAAVCDPLGRAGFRANAHVGDPPDSFGEARKAAEYIVGQAMSSMAKGMPPHPMTADWALKVLRNGGL